MKELTSEELCFVVGGEGEVTTVGTVTVTGTPPADGATSGGSPKAGDNNQENSGAYREV